MKRSKSENNGSGFEADENLENQKQQQPYLSGAHIRSFVKQLTSSRTNMKEKGSSLEREGNISGEQDLSENVNPDGGKAQHPSQQQQKKQVRRRLHTRKPYQEKLLNMAEARREIVSALKLHRAAMKQASEKQRLLESGPGFQTGDEEAANLKSRRNPRIYASNSYTHDSYKLFPVNFSDNNVVYPSTGFCNNPYSWSVPSIAPPPIFHENLDFALPSQTLGLNLNLQDFFNTPSSSIYSSSSSSTSSASPTLSAATEEVPVTGATTQAAEVVDFGEQNFVKSMEIRAECEKDEEFVSSPFDEVMEFPAWLNANESSCLQRVNDFCSEDYFQDPALPCLDIEEIEGMDGDWLA